MEVILSDGAAVEVKRLSKHLDLIIYLPDAVKGMFRYRCMTLLLDREIPPRNSQVFLMDYLGHGLLTKVKTYTHQLDVYTCATAVQKLYLNSATTVRMKSNTLLYKLSKQKINIYILREGRVGKEQSLFTYRSSESYEFFNDLQYRPDFEPIPTNASLDFLAKELCGASRQCYFDYVVTGDRQLAFDTAVSYQEFNQILSDIKPGIDLR